MSDELCVRCNHVGTDRRTLWMACFYEMNELKLPFEQETLFSVDKNAVLQKFREPTALKLSDGKELVLAAGTVTTDYELFPKGFYTLRVCKRCRAEWLNAIQTWFNKTPEGEDDDATDVKEEKKSLGTGIFVRKNGMTVEISEEEWYERNPFQEPVRWKPKSSESKS